MANSAAAAPSARPVAFARSIPAWTWLAGLIVCSIAVRYAFARRMASPWIMVDELIYSELAKSFAESAEFRWRDVPISAYGPVYPLLLSPAFALFASVPDAYAAAKAINSVVVSLAAIPAYLLARRVLAPTPSLFAAGLALAVPSMLYAGTLMTENAFYPVFLAACLALVLLLERPTAPRLLALLGLCAFAFATRVQAIALLPALLTAPLVLALMGGGRRTLREHRLLYGVVGAAGALLLVVQLARGRSLRGILGAYQVLGERDYDVASVARWLVLHVAELDLYVGVAPFAALLLLLALARRLDRAEQALLAAAVSVTFWLVLAVAAFASLPTVERIEERNMFYVAPFFFVALLLWIERGMPRPRAPALVAAVAAALAPALLPYHELIGVQAQSDTLMLLPWWWLQDHVVSLGQVRWVVLACALVISAAFLLLPRRLALALPAFVLAYYALTLAPIENGRHGVRMASLGALFQGITTGRRDWVDAEVGRDAEVAFLWTGKADAFALWANEFFNRSVGRVYDLGPGLGGGLPATVVEVDRRDGLLRDADGHPVRERYVLTDESIPLAGEPRARDAQKGIVLRETSGPLRVAQLVSGLYEGDTWSAARATYTRLDCEGGLLEVTVASDARLFTRPQTLTARSGATVTRFLVRGDTPRKFLVELQRTSRERCTVWFSVAPTAVPERALRGSRDRRVLGLHFIDFRYLPAGSA